MTDAYHQHFLDGLSAGVDHGWKEALAARVGALESSEAAYTPLNFRPGDRARWFDQEDGDWKHGTLTPSPTAGYDWVLTFDNGAGWTLATTGELATIPAPEADPLAYAEQVGS